jgi:hypothetical protein
VITVVGGGIAGCAAALSAVKEGLPVVLYEQSTGPRHKVCGEFLSPEAWPLLEALGAAGKIDALTPSRIRRMRLCFGGKREHQQRFAEPATGISRYNFDQALLGQVREAGVLVRLERLNHPPSGSVIATGRTRPQSRGRRLFGFKAHFKGAADDSVEMHFQRRWYVGITCVEAGVTNVCGLAPEDVLGSYAFDIDSMLANTDGVRQRLAPLTRINKWLLTGPLIFGPAGAAETYVSGDAFWFMDPFTGCGMYAALLTGIQAGRAAARGTPPQAYTTAATCMLRKPYLVSSACRTALQTGLAEWLNGPYTMIFRATRPG